MCSFVGSCDELICNAVFISNSKKIKKCVNK